jgi:hypothetical protein
MATECARWSENMDAFQASLATPSAIVIWRVLIAAEQALVADALERVIAEISERRSGEAADAVPAKGEDVRHLDGDRTGFGKDNHTSED